MPRSIFLPKVLTAIAGGLALVGLLAATPGHAQSVATNKQAIGVNATSIGTDLSKGVALQAGDVAQFMQAGDPVRVNVALKVRNHQELREVADQVRAGKRAPLTDRELEDRYLPSRADAMRVYDFLLSNGFRQIYVSKDHTIVTAWGSAANVQSAFKTRMRYLRRGTLDGVANVDPVVVPAALSDVVSAVLGLRSFDERGLSGAVAASAPKGAADRESQGVAQPESTTCTVCSHAPTDFPSLYNATGLVPASSEVVAIIGVGDQRNTTYLYQQWADNYGFSHIPLTFTYPTGYTSGDFESQTEAALDVDAVSTMAGSLQGIAFYSAPSTDLSDELAAVTAAVADNRPVISLSFAASCDADIPLLLRTTWDTALTLAVAKNITVFAITQDDGGHPQCSNGGTSTGFPGSSPYVVSVGGSTLYNTTASYSAYDHETLWSGSESGPAATEPRPYYQNVVAAIAGTHRSTPDFVMDGDPNSGLWIVNGGYNSSGNYQTQWQVIGGTSLAAPLLAGTYALILQSGIAPYFWQQTYYDIGVDQVSATNGDCLNCYHLLTGGTNGAYTVVPGQFNQASGWGSWNAGSLANAMRYQR